MTLITPGYCGNYGGAITDTGALFTFDACYMCTILFTLPRNLPPLIKAHVITHQFVTKYPSDLIRIARAMKFMNQVDNVFTALISFDMRIVS